MMKLFMAAVIAFAVTGCNTSQKASVTAAIAAGRAVAASTPRIAKTANKVDSAINTASQKLASYCPTLQSAVVQVGIGASQAYASSKSATAADTISAARTISASFCAQPPSDLISAAQLVEAAISELQSKGLLGGVKVQAVPMSLHRYHRWVALHRVA